YVLELQRPGHGTRRRACGLRPIVQLTVCPGPPAIRLVGRGHRAGVRVARLDVADRERTPNGDWRGFGTDSGDAQLTLEVSSPAIGLAAGGDAAGVQLSRAYPAPGQSPAHLHRR